MSLNKSIEDKVKELQQELNSQSAYLANINDALRKLRTDRKTVEFRIREINGSVQAFSAVLNATQPKEDAQAANSEVVEGEIVKE